MKYLFSIKTADEYKAGTDANIFVILEGEFGKTEEIRLNGYISGNAFERNNVDSCTVDFKKDVGRVFRIIVRSDMMYAGAGWRVSYFELTRKGGKKNDLSDKLSRFDINEWIEDKKNHIYTVSYNDWSKNIDAYETKTVPYKQYSFTVPGKGKYDFSQQETTTTGFYYSNTITKKSTEQFNQKLSAEKNYSKNVKEAEGLESSNSYKGYLEFAFSQGFESTEIDEVIQKEDKTIEKTVTATVSNETDKTKKYTAKFDLIKINALTSTGGVVEMFSANEEIVFAGFEEV